MTPYLQTRRSPAAFAIVAALHVALASLVLRSVALVRFEEGVSDPARRGAATRLEVSLLELAPAPFTPPPTPTISTPQRIRLDAPAFELGDNEPGPEDRLRGLYLGQVRARIERAWESVSLAPRATDAVSCEVTIVQDARGGVIELTFPACPLDERARADLARVIRGAAPLPAPPAELAIRSEVSLTLEIRR